MNERRAFAVGMIAAALGCVSAPLRAQSSDEDRDLQLIPKTAQSATAVADLPQSGGAAGRAYLEDVLSGWDNRAPSPEWQNRTSADVDFRWPLNATIKVSLSDRLNVYSGDTVASPSSANLRNDLREAYVSDEVAPRTYLELGRANIKSGVAYGYNPTDYFKTRTAVEIASIDPSVARDDRLGVVLAQVQKLWNEGSLSVAFAPKLREATPLTLSTTPASFDPLWGRTNAANRGLATASWSGSAFNPQLLLASDELGTHWGANVSRVLNSSIVGHLEWSGVRERPLWSRALSFGESTGSIPSGAIAPSGISTAKIFSNDFAVGASWTSSTNFTVNLEYHYHQSGFDYPQWSHWIDMDHAGPMGAAQAWFVREYASDQQEPLFRREFFVRADWQDVLPSRLNLGGVAFITERDGSALAQVYAKVFVTRRWTLSAFLGATTGSPRSDYGSLPWRASALLQAVRYL
jgi:opacity protein-like surface antigen